MMRLMAKKFLVGDAPHIHTHQTHIGALLLRRCFKFSFSGGNYLTILLLDWIVTGSRCRASITLIAGGAEIKKSVKIVVVVILQ